ncbi:DUF3558 domain-containing protein [Nocardia sp. 004]|uniref:DUF3558 domain-containing protein n=1 Tax=Nocardia sp. 004 TaxID=3385978 RepID=UPI0039A0063C
MRTVTRFLAAGLAVGTVAGMVGCSIEGTPIAADTSATSASGAPASSTPPSNTAWNPCSIPDADIAAAGLNPERRVADTGQYGAKFPGWDICGWNSDSWYGINVYSTNAHTFDEIVNNTNNYRNPHPVAVGGRSAVMLDLLNLPEGCGLVFDTISGPVKFDLIPKLSADTVGDSCAEVMRIAEALLENLPADK